MNTGLSPTSATTGFSLVILVEIVVAMLAGVGVALQPGMNAKFAEFAGHRIHGGIANFAGGLATMLLVWLIASRFTAAPAPDPSKLSMGPWWMWLGGALGAFFVTTAVFLAPKMGVANYVAALIAGQLIMSVVIDHFGWMGFVPIALSPARVIGVVMILGGLVCIRWL